VSASIADPSDAGRRTAVLGVVAFAVIAVGTLAWAKWVPYLHRVDVTAGSGVYPGSDVLAKAGDAGAAPSLSAAWEFTKAYSKAVWPALVAALLIAAAIEALVPRRWLLQVLGRDGTRGRITAGVAAMPSMMCTCCTAPVARTLRRTGVPTGTALAYWLGNPLLNPAVIVFLAIVLPWQWAATRVIVGAVLVFGVTGLVARWLAPRDASVALEDADPEPETADPSTVRRFVRALTRLSVVLVPEYLVLILLVGLLRGWLLPLGDSAAAWPVLFTLLAAVAGTLVVIPTGGEIPLMAGLAALGVGAGPLGALLITLPAISIPSMVMVGRAMGWRVTAGTGVAVAVCGTAAGALLWALTAV
jgi:uncharacterized membrane protein YraQ (UPF0718 family)